MTKNSLTLFVAIAVSLSCERAFGLERVCVAQITATPIGYEYLQDLENGDVVRAFTTKSDLGRTNDCKAVLFTVLSPEQYFGLSFLLQDAGCNCAQCRKSSLDRQYIVGRRYHFSGDTNLISMLFSVGDPREMRIVNARNYFGKIIPETGVHSCWASTKNSIDASTSALKRMWNADLKDLAEAIIPAHEYRQTTVTSILAHVDEEYRKLKPGLRINWDVECKDGPPDVEWKMPYDFSHGNISALDVLQKIGKLPCLSFKVDTSFRHSAFFKYSFPANSEYCDWTHSIYSRIIPDRVFQKATVEELVQWLYSIQERWAEAGLISGATYSYGIKSLHLRTKTKPMSFIGMTLREAIRYIANEFGVEYDFKTSAWQEKMKQMDLNTTISPSKNEKSDEESR